MPACCKPSDGFCKSRHLFKAIPQHVLEHGGVDVMYLVQALIPLAFRCAVRLLVAKVFALVHVSCELQADLDRLFNTPVWLTPEFFLQMAGALAAEVDMVAVPVTL